MNWISVKDKMPNYGQEVLVYPVYGAFQSHNITAMTVYNDGKGGSRFESGNDTITHWMQMPNKPKND